MLAEETTLSTVSARLVAGVGKTGVKGRDKALKGVVVQVAIHVDVGLSVVAEDLWHMHLPTRVPKRAGSVDDSWTEGLHSEARASPTRVPMQCHLC